MIIINRIRKQYDEKERKTPNFKFSLKFLFCISSYFTFIGYALQLFFPIFEIKTFTHRSETKVSLSLWIVLYPILSLPLSLALFLKYLRFFPLSLEYWYLFCLWYLSFVKSKSESTSNKLICHQSYKSESAILFLRKENNTL